MDEPDRNNLENILIALRDAQASVREQAIQQLTYYVNSAGSAAEDDTLTEAEALDAWGKARKEQLQDSRIVEALLTAIEDSSARIRATTALLLGDSSNPEAQEALIRHLLHDPHHQVRMMCVSALGYRPYTARKTEAFIAALQDAHYQVVYPACQSLGKIGDPKAIEPLRSVLSHPAWNVRFEACEALVRLKAVDHQVVSLLEELSQQPEARAHDDIVRSVTELNIQYMSEQERADPHARAQTTQEVLDQALRQLDP